MAEEPRTMRRNITHMQQHTCEEGSLLTFCSVVPKRLGIKPPYTLGAGVFVVLVCCIPFWPRGYR